MKESQLENKTAIATNDYVRMVDENGNSVKIKKDSFMAAIRDALPSIISDGETGGGSVLSIINGALKSRTDANLASVLGGAALGKDVLDNPPMGIRMIYVGSKISGYADGVCISCKKGESDNVVFQIAMAYKTGDLSYRSLFIRSAWAISEGWSSWKAIATF